MAVISYPSQEVVKKCDEQIEYWKKQKHNKLTSIALDLALFENNSWAVKYFGKSPRPWSELYEAAKHSIYWYSYDTNIEYYENLKRTASLAPTIELSHQEVGNLEL